MTTVHLIFDTKELDVDRNILLQFDYFQNLLEIAPDNIKINNIDIELFQILIKMIENNNLIKDIVHLCDFLGHNNICEPLNEYKCKTNNCHKISFNKTFCECHKCAVEECNVGHADEYKYCYAHKCIINFCDNIRYNYYYCITHKQFI